MPELTDDVTEGSVLFSLPNTQNDGPARSTATRNRWSWPNVSSVVGMKPCSKVRFRSRFGKQVVNEQIAVRIEFRLMAIPYDQLVWG